MGAPVWRRRCQGRGAPFLKPVPVPTADQAAEPDAEHLSGIARLKRECDRLRMERDILKKSISIFAGPLR